MDDTYNQSCVSSNEAQALFDAIRAIVNSEVSGSWQEKKQSLLSRADQDEQDVLEEFLSWWD
jgi:hypothetical protein